MAETDLRPMTLGEVLDRTFSLYKTHFWLFAGIMSLPLLALLLFQVCAAGLGIAGATAGRGVGAAPTAGTIAGVAFGAIIGVVLYFALYGAAQAATVFAVSDLYLGRQASVRGSFTQVRGKILRALGVIFLTGLIVFVGTLALIIPGLILLARTGVSVPTAMLEDESPSAAISRSMELTKGFGMQMFLIFLLVWVLSMVVTIIFQFPLLFLAAEAARPHVASFTYSILSDLASFISSVVIGPIGTIAFSLMYYNLRVRKEAFDLQHLMASLGSSSGRVVSPGASPVA
ncbi:MAG TPA: hypothetical protein VLY23_19125 [Candidatus Acidoferrum sp.]|nr:hypothetical protein [Candidatus Acidoferrum sp.]